MRYKISDYLIEKESFIDEDVIFLYHSIFGNLTRIEKKMYNQILSKKYFFNDEISNFFNDEEFTYLKENFFLVEDTVDEQELIKIKIQNREKQILNGEEFEKIQLIMTNSCNFKCKYCFCNHFEKEKNTDKMSFEVANESILNAIKVLKKNGKNKLIISFFGGEPSLNLEVIKKVLDKFGNFYLETHISYEYTSNGSIMNEEIAKIFFKYKVTVCFSIDYLEPNGLTYRGDGNNLIKWKEIEDNIKILTNLEVVLEVSSVLSEETINKNFYYLVDILSKYKIKRIYLVLSFGKDFYRLYSPTFISNKVLEYYKYCLKKDISLEGYWYETFTLIVDSEKFKEKEAYKTCPSIGKMVSIEPNGNIFSCKTTNRKLGNIKNFENIFKNEGYRHYSMRAYINSNYCLGCEIQGFCSGNCLGANENNLGDIYKVDPLFCETMKNIVNGILNFYINDI